MTQIFIYTEGIAVPIGTTIKDVKAKKETYPVTVDAKISKCSI